MIDSDILLGRGCQYLSTQTPGEWTFALVQLNQSISQSGHERVSSSKLKSKLLSTEDSSIGRVMSVCSSNSI